MFLLILRCYWDDRANAVSDLPNGMYFHFGLRECLQRALENTAASANGIINLQMHVDSLSSLKILTWQRSSILGCPVRPRSSIFSIGHFGGISKHMDMREFVRHSKWALSFLKKRHTPAGHWQNVSSYFAPHHSGCHCRDFPEKGGTAQWINHLWCE